MFILYAIPIGLVLGLLLGGRVASLTTLRFRWAWLAVGGLAVQIAIFSEPIGSMVSGAIPAIYVASNVAVLAAVLRNLGIPGMAIIAVGAGCNLAAIVANGGYMPADPAALAMAGMDVASVNNSIVVADPALWPLTDIFALPAAVPLSNVFSVGDVLIGVGVIVTIVVAMRRDVQPAPGRAGGPL